MTAVWLDWINAGRADFWRKAQLGPVPGAPRAAAHRKAAAIGNIAAPTLPLPRMSEAGAAQAMAVRRGALGSAPLRCSACGWEVVGPRFDCLACAGGFTACVRCEPWLAAGGHPAGHVFCVRLGPEPWQRLADWLLLPVIVQKRAVDWLVTRLYLNQARALACRVGFLMIALPVQLLYMEILLVVALCFVAFGLPLLGLMALFQAD